MLNVPPPPPRRAIRVSRNGSLRLPDKCAIEWCENEVTDRRNQLAGDLPVCVTHGVQIWQQIQHQNDSELVVRTSAELAEIRRADQAEYRARRPLLRAADERAAKAERERETRMAEWRKHPGHVYFVRLNGLIKVGWSSQLHNRLRAYGPEVEVLCHFEARRVDETGLHQTLAPFRAHGREWYEDCKFIHDMVADSIQKHGPPYIKAHWTKPGDEFATSGRRAAIHRSSR